MNEAGDPKQKVVMGKGDILNYYLCSHDGIGRHDRLKIYCFRA